MLLKHKNLIQLNVNNTNYTVWGTIHYLYILSKPEISLQHCFLKLADITSTNCDCEN